MKIADVRANAFAMPLNDPAYPKPPYRFYNRGFVVITYRTDPNVLRAVVPERPEVVGDAVAYEFIRMPDSTGFGDYTETGQVIPVRFTTPAGEVQEGGYVHAMYLDDNSPIACGREIWGFPKRVRSDSGRLQPEVAGVRHPAGRDQHMAADDLRRARLAIEAHRHPPRVRAKADTIGTGRDRDALARHDLADRLGDVRILARSPRPARRNAIRWW